eukprot:3076745-Prymnesium_polylepis.1
MRNTCCPVKAEAASTLAMSGWSVAIALAWAAALAVVSVILSITLPASTTSSTADSAKPNSNTYFIRRSNCFSSVQSEGSPATVRTTFTTKEAAYAPGGFGDGGGSDGGDVHARPILAGAAAWGRAAKVQRAPVKTPCRRLVAVKVLSRERVIVKRSRRCAAEPRCDAALVDCGHGIEVGAEAISAMRTGRRHHTTNHPRNAPCVGVGCRLRVIVHRCRVHAALNDKRTARQGVRHRVVVAHGRLLGIRDFARAA